jgi:hypothetical protein
MTKSLTYNEAACKLLEVTVLPLAPTPAYPRIEHNPGGLTDEDEYELQCQVCLLTNLSPNDWPNLDEGQRLVWMRLALGKKRDGEASSLEKGVKAKKTAQGKSSNPVEALLGEDFKEIIDITRSAKSADDRMRAICGLDRKHLSKNSEEWANLLSVTGAAIRKTTFWKEERQVSIEAWNELTH